MFELCGCIEVTFVTKINVHRNAFRCVWEIIHRSATKTKYNIGRYKLDCTVHNKNIPNRFKKKIVHSLNAYYTNNNLYLYNILYIRSLNSIQLFSIIQGNPFRDGQCGPLNQERIYRARLYIIFLRFF